MEFHVTVVKKQDQVDYINYLHASPSLILWNWKTNLKSGFAMQNNVIYDHWWFETVFCFQ